jgi:hypothetical protein
LPRARSAPPRARRSGAAAPGAAPRRARSLALSRAFAAAAMVYYESWDEFYRLAEQLYRAAPLRVRAAARPRARETRRATASHTHGEGLGLRRRVVTRNAHAAPPAAAPPADALLHEVPAARRRAGAESHGRRAGASQRLITLSLALRATRLSFCSRVPLPCLAWRSV